MPTGPAGIYSTSAGKMRFASITHLLLRHELAAIIA